MILCRPLSKEADVIAEQINEHIQVFNCYGHYMVAFTPQFKGFHHLDNFKPQVHI